MTVKERSKSILEVAVKNFIETGQLISSKRLYEIYDFGIKPAMIRWELSDLSEQGYFYQRHPSGGRLPTDKAYRFYVKSILSQSYEVSKNNLKKKKKKKIKVDTLVNDLVKELKVLGVGYEAEDGNVYQHGLKVLFDQMDIENKEDFLEVVNDFERLPERLLMSQDWWQNVQEWPQVFIGRSPLTTSHELSVIADCFDRGNNNFLLIAIGPKRMNYQKSLELFRALEENFC